MTDLQIAKAALDSAMDARTQVNCACGCSDRAVNLAIRNLKKMGF